jgi:hypothetical protein
MLIWEARMKEQIVLFVDSLKSDRRIVMFDEAATKQAVVLRLLLLLGWDTFNIDEVAPEYSVGAQRVDYSLRIDRTNKVFIEVKRISEELERHQEQLLNYSFQEGVKLSILTNGVSWWFYLPLHEGSWEQRKFYSIDVLQQESEDVAQKFIDFLSKDNTSSGQAIKNAEAIYSSRKKKKVLEETLPKAWNKIISDLDEVLVELLSETTEKLCGHRADSELIESFMSKNRNDWLISEISVTKVSPTPGRKFISKKPSRLTGYTGKSISSFSFRGNVYEVRFWKDMLVTLCEVLASMHEKDFEKVLGLFGRTRRYFSDNANELWDPREIPNTNLFVETNLSANSIVKLSKDVISLFGYSPGELKINASEE